MRLIFFYKYALNLKKITLKKKKKNLLSLSLSLSYGNKIFTGVISMIWCSSPTSTSRLKRSFYQRSSLCHIYIIFYIRNLQTHHYCCQDICPSIIHEIFNTCFIHLTIINVQKVLYLNGITCPILLEESEF